ncbi:MAG: YceI family protein [Acidobacteriota bacterium]|nr:YceI family protein [Acidobacteriota bacterium]
MSTITADAIQSGTYNVDAAHSNVGFEVRHMGIATVRGQFRKFEGVVDATEGKLTLSGSVEVATIDTGDANRDGHLQSPEFFDAAQFPQISFASTGTEPAADGKIKLSGEITIKGTTKPIELLGEIAENGEDPWGNERVGFEVEGKIDRREFGLDWNQVLPNGNLLVANEVKLVVSVSAVKAA